MAKLIEKVTDRAKLAGDASITSLEGDPAAQASQLRIIPETEFQSDYGFDFGSLSLIEVPIKNLFGNDYVLREAGEDAAVRFQNAATKAAKMSDGKVIGVDGAANAEPLLVGLCLWRKDDQGRYTIQVGEAQVRGWPHRVVKPLYAKAKEISHLEDNSEEGLQKQIDSLTDRLHKQQEARKTIKNSLNGTSTSSNSAEN